MFSFIITIFAFANPNLSSTNIDTTNNYLQYHELINEATYASFKEEYQKADSLFEEAFKLDALHLGKNYQAACYNVLQINETEKAFSYLKQAMQHGLSIDKIQNSSYFNQIQYQDKWLILEKAYPTLREEYESQFDTERRQAIQEIYQLDQDARLKGAGNFDADNLKRLQKIVEEQGYPGFHKVGQDIDLHLVFHHFSPEDNKRYFYDVLKKAVFTGDITPFEYAGIIDYDRIKKREPTLYGTYFATVDGIRYLQPVEDFEHVNERRKSIGLEPIERQMENMILSMTLIF